MYLLLCNMQYGCIMTLRLHFEHHILNPLVVVTHSGVDTRDVGLQTGVKQEKVIKKVLPLTSPQPTPQLTRPTRCQLPRTSQTSGPPPSPLHASLPSSPPAQRKPWGGMSWGRLTVTGWRRKSWPSLVACRAASHSRLLSTGTST